MELRFRTYSSPQKVWFLTVLAQFSFGKTIRRNLLHGLLYAALASCLVFGTESPVLAKTFDLGVQHTEVLPSVSEELKPGANFNLSAVEAEGYFARHDFQYGMQKDREGGIWHYIGTPYHSKTALSQFTEYHLVKSKEFTKADEQGVSFTTVMTVIRSNSSSQILESFQQESITTYTPTAESGSIEMTASTKSFDANGKANRQSDNIAKIKQSTPFVEVDIYQGKDMKALFRQYLISKGLDKLLPAEQSATE